jgi:hypothetical protein
LAFVLRKSTFHFHFCGTVGCPNKLIHKSLAPDILQMKQNTRS